MTRPHYPRIREITSVASLALAATLAFGGVAPAAASYSVKLRVPRYVNVGQSFRVKATGTSGGRAHLAVFLARKRCANNAAAEAKRAVQTLVSKNVLGAYTGSKTLRARSGTYNVCAYLTSTGQSPVTRAGASATYYVLAGGY
jgi:hypothetical protein